MASLHADSTTLEAAEMLAATTREQAMSEATMLAPTTVEIATMEAIMLDTAWMGQT